MRLIVFDCDGTLVDSQHNICRAMAGAFAENGLAPPADAAIRRIVGLSLPEGISQLAPKLPEPAIQAVTASYRSAFRALREAPDFDEPLFPGVREVLEKLERGGCLLGIATGKGRRGLGLTLDHHGIAGHFTTLQTADDGPGKPNPRMLEQAMAETGAGPGQTALVGDTSHDMAMAHNAGTAAVGVSWGYHGAAELRAAGAAAVLDDFGQLPGLLDDLLGAAR